MLLYRIAQAAHAADLNGEGARIHGGRWNPAGIAVVYTSETVALAVLELLANVPHHLIAVGDFRKIVIEVPDTAKIRVVEPVDLPDGWNRFPHPPSLAGIGSAWAASGDALLLKVPCAVTIGNGYNYLINPLHPQASAVRVVANDRFTFDARVLGIKAP